MASGQYHCKDCSIYFDSQQSLTVHLRYHHENLINMWMGSEEKKDCISASHPNSEFVRGSSSENNMQNINSIELSSISSGNLDNFKMNSQHVKIEQDDINGSESNSVLNYYKTEASIKSEPIQSDLYPSSSTPSYNGPPISPMEYEFKMSPGLQSPQNSLIAQGPSSGQGSASFPQQSPGGYYQDYNQSLMQQTQNSFANFSTNFINGGYEDPYYGRTAPAMPRYHPYTGRSPVPTPSPGAPIDLKEERLTPEILDLDSQKVLNSIPSSQSSSMGGTLPQMWRPHEFPASSGTTLVKTQSGLGGPSPGLGQPTSRHGSSPSGIGSIHGGIGAPSGIGTSSGRVIHSPTGLGASPNNGLVISSVMNPSALGPSMGMMPPMGQTYGGQHSLPPTHSISVNSSNSPMSSYYPSQGVSVSGGLSNGPQFVNAPVPSPSSREPPPSEYPSNVKRAKSFKCDDCNKWFTSHGHLKRHYNTTLHKNMTKLNSNPSSTTPQPAAQEVTRPPILSPSAKSIGEASTTSCHDEETNMSAKDSLEPTGAFHPTISAFQPPPASLPNFSPHNQYPGHSAPSLVPINTNLPHFSQAHSFLSEQPLTAPAMYHGHFSTNPTYPPQPPTTISGPFFPSGNNYIFPPQGGLHGPGLHSMNEYSGPNPVDSFNNYRLNNGDRGHQLISVVDSINGPSPDPAGDTGSEASMDSSESSPGATENYKCNDCSKTFNRMCYLTQHRSTYHEGEKPFKCGTCGKRFPDEVTFTDHQGKHAGEKPYKCEVCPKQFNHKTDLRRHMCLHTGEKPFSCEQCGKGFIRKDHMLKHFQTHRKKALAAAANASSHPSMSPNNQGFPQHGLGPQHAPLAHPPPHGPHGRPQHVVAPPVY